MSFLVNPPSNLGQYYSYYPNRKWSALIQLQLARFLPTSFASHRSILTAYKSAADHLPNALPVSPPIVLLLFPPVLFYLLFDSPSLLDTQIHRTPLSECWNQ